MEPFHNDGNSLPVVEYGVARGQDFWRSGVLWGIVSFLAVLLQLAWLAFLIFAKLRWNSEPPDSMLVCFWPVYLAFASATYSLWMTGLRPRNVLGVLEFFVSGTAVVLQVMGFFATK
jgi:hypothetical protein